ncbi:hypothetical protein [uncultured Vagococcus sp.]|uniref:hypothetical protein n=1 Tax=uncultured Vagococcus sp. TaxID=189676 RepID=UPI0028D81146|nr:hypothetical protein [uncultured Vagococcus sp.]
MTKFYTIFCIVAAVVLFPCLAMIVSGFKNKKVLLTILGFIFLIPCLYIVYIAYVFIALSTIDFSG